MSVVSLQEGFVVDLEDDSAVASLLERTDLPPEIAEAVRQVDAVRILANRYEIGDVIGRGATSTVCRGRDLQFNCPIAIKLLDPPGDKAGDAALRAAIGEARTVRRINSPHVVRVHDAGIDGVPYIVMDLEMEKDGAAEYAAAALSEEAYRPRSLREAMEWVRDAARGVAAAHRLGIYHYDIKPRNLLVEPVSRRAKLIDFGVAATVHGVGGTPAYMAPEHARAILDRVAFNTLDGSKLDIFGLGALAHHLIYGKPPRAAAAGIETQLAAAVDAPPTVPRHKRTVWGTCPRRAAAIVRRALARDPQDRYASAAEMAQDIESWLAGFPLQFEHRRPLIRLGLWCIRARRALTAFALALAGILALAIVSMRLWSEVASASARLEAVSRQIASREGELAITNEQLTAKSRELAESNSTNQRLSQNVVELGRKLALNVDGNHQLQQFAEKLSAQSKRLAGDLELTGNELLATRQQLVRTKHDLDLATKQVEERNGDLAKLQASLEKVHVSLGVTKDELAGARRDLARMASGLTTASSELGTTKAELASTKHELMRAENRLLERQVIFCQSPTSGYGDTLSRLVGTTRP